MYYTYVLYSESHTRYYTGHTNDLGDRLKRHNAGLVKSTKAYRTWEIVYTEEFATKAEAYKREMEIKSYKSGIKFKELIRKGAGVVERGGLENR